MRLHRADPILNDAIESLDQFLREAKRQLPKSTPEEQRNRAWNLLRDSPNSFQFVLQEIARCTNDRVYYLQNYHVIQPEQGILTCLAPLYDHQWMVENTLARLMADEGQARIITLKPRQSGLTEYCTGVSCWRTFFLPHAYTIAVAQAPDVAAHIQRKIILAYNSLPWWMQSEQLYRTKGEFLEWGRKDATHSADPGLGSVLVTTHAMRTTGVAIGRCQTPETVVWTEYGPRTLAEIAVEFAEAEPCAYDGIGWWYNLRRPLYVYSSDNGRAVLKKVTRVYRQHYEGPIQVCKIEGGVDIRKTPEHAVLVENQWKKTLEAGDFVSRLGRIPRSTDAHALTYPDEAELIGWQLAEGHENKNSLHITQKCDKTRQHIADLIARVARPSTINDHPACGKINKYGNECVGYLYVGCPWYRRSLESRGYQWGCNWTRKQIPDFIFTAPDDCVVAFLRGFFEADASVSHVIDIGQMSKNLMEGLRFLLARFGITLRFSTVQKRETRANRRNYEWTYYRGFIGGPSLVRFYEEIGFISDHKQARLRATAMKAKGSNSERQVTVTRMIRQGVEESGTTVKWVTGSWRYKHDQMLTRKSSETSIQRLKSAIDKVPAYRGGKKTHWAFANFNAAAAQMWAAKAEAELDKHREFDQVKSVESEQYSGMVYDLEVEGTHCYTVSGLITHNTVRTTHCSEVSRWPDGEVWTGDIEPSMNAPDAVAFMESTAWGNEGFFYNLWQEAISGDSDWTPVFLAAYRAKKYSLPIKPSQQPFTLTPAETAFTERIRREEKWEISPEFWNWRRKRIKASVSRTGFPYAHYESYPITPEEAFQSSGMGAFPRHKLDEQQQRNVKKPEWIGEIVYQGKGAIPNLHLNHMIDRDGNYLDIALEKRELTNRLYVWEQPDPSASYYVGSDIGDGILGSDFTVAEIFRAGYGMEPDFQVAEWVGYEPPIAFAKILYALGWWYNQAEIAVEYAREGMATGNELAMGLEYPKIYVPRHPDKTGNQLTRYIHWQTTSKTKPYLMTRMNESLLEDSIVIRSQYLLDELRRCVKDSTSFAGLGGHDDAAVAAAICHYCMRETMPELRRAARQQTESTFSAPSASRQPAIGTRLFYILDEFYRLRAQTRDLNKAMEFLSKNPGWSVRPIVASKANTHYSTIHYGTGLENELFRGGMSDRDISPGLVTEYAAATGRLTQHGELARADGSASSGGDYGGDGGGGMWDSGLGDLGGDLGDWGEF